MKRTKIICTLGPASETKTTIKKMIQSGMNIARLNFSHGTYENHLKLVQNVRDASKEAGEHVALLQDLQGPKIRFGQIDGVIEISSGDKLLLIPEGKSTSIKKKVLPIGYEGLHEYVEKGDRLFFDDGLIEVVVDKVADTFMYATAKNAGKVKSHKGINLPDAKKSIDSLTKKDKKDLAFGIENNVDFVALSFVQTADDVRTLRKLIEKHEEELDTKPETPTQIIVKIEKRQAVENFAEILEEANGVMIARGDLALETSFENVPLYQKELIERSLHAAKPVIVATQMLDSMTNNPRPTRAEISDVSNAVIDHTDGVMLSQESAVGEYPVETVKMMATIISETEESPYDDLEEDELREMHLPLDIALSGSAVKLLKDFKADALLIVSDSEVPARIISSYRPEVPIIVAASHDRAARQLVLSWGVIPLVVVAKSEDERIKKALKKAEKEGMLKKGMRVIVVGSESNKEEANVNIIKVGSV